MPFDLQPILNAELLELRPLRAEDYHDLYAGCHAHGFAWAWERRNAPLATAQPLEVRVEPCPRKAVGMAPDARDHHAEGITLFPLSIVAKGSGLPEVSTAAGDSVRWLPEERTDWGNG